MLAGVGAWRFSEAGARADEIAALNAAPGIDGAESSGDAYKRYGGDYDALRSDYDDEVFLGAVLAGVGGAAVVTGIVLLVMDGDEDPPAAVGPLVVPGGGGLMSSFAF